MSSQQPTAPCSASERDADGRIVGLVYDSTPALSDPGLNAWLLALDGSDNALRAVSHAADQAARMRGCALHLVHVQPWLSREAAERELGQRGLGNTARARELLDARGLAWRLHIVMGDPVERILERAALLHADTIVIGSRGLNVVERVLLGSVATRLVHLAPIPVMVVP